jgi:hypothetical protein
MAQPPGSRPGLMHPRQQRDRRNWRVATQFVRRGGIDDVSRRNVRSLALVFTITGRFPADMMSTP